jgi:hypothetical protein
MDVRSMGDDAVVVIKDDDDEAKSAWPAWKHLLEVSLPPPLPRMSFSTHSHRAPPYLQDIPKPHIVSSAFAPPSFISGRDPSQTNFAA